MEEMEAAVNAATSDATKVWMVWMDWMMIIFLSSLILFIGSFQQDLFSLP